jgi:serine-type D-Ala-D-Ala endopeptidase (penicillin-binding protein 7)
LFRIDWFFVLRKINVKLTQKWITAALSAICAVMFLLMNPAAADAAQQRKVVKKTAKPLMAKQRVSAAHPVKRKTSKIYLPHQRNVNSVVFTQPVRQSFGQLYGLHNTKDSLDLKSSVAFVLDSETNEILLSKNSQAVLPIASLTKLMTALVVIEAQLPLHEILWVSQEDVDTEKGSSSRLSVGTSLSREEMLHLALMSSENRAAHALGRYFPGGMSSFVREMNKKAQDLGMRNTRYVEPTGLSSANQSSAEDLATLVKAAHSHPIIRELSTSPEYQFAVGNRPLQFHNTNLLVRNPTWEIGLQKTGYISEAGRCLVMQAKLAGRQLIMVFLDSAGKYSRIGDAERVRQWLTESLAQKLQPTYLVLAPKLSP